MCTCLTEFDEETYKEGLLEEGRAEGRAEGQKLANIENAKNLFANGATFELVRKSILSLSDEILREIYEEVMANQKC